MTPNALSSFMSEWEGMAGWLCHLDNPCFASPLSREHARSLHARPPGGEESERRGPRYSPTILSYYPPAEHGIRESDPSEQKEPFPSHSLTEERSQTTSVTSRLRSESGGSDRVGPRSVRSRSSFNPDRVEKRKRKTKRKRIEKGTPRRHPEGFSFFFFSFLRIGFFSSVSDAKS
ncbi:hypothetical protein IE53DRAFT_233583 [Violaceomyces palustris]|uniref:Uncharacterized protein n=1 Tax=Violaceomyces palustris TaxID=1673888 RepID=A0ACD0NPP4_9BASI|nr:hypothetical protein IE53DRAFT_233583 [Violaceomyces palustris]